MPNHQLDAVARDDHVRPSAIDHGDNARIVVGRNERASVGLIPAGFLLRWSIAMSRTGWSPITIPYGAD